VENRKATKTMSGPGTRRGFKKISTEADLTATRGEGRKTMIVITLQTRENISPLLSVHGGIVKLDLGALLLEMDKETFLNLIADLIKQSAKLGVLEQPIR